MSQLIVFSDIDGTLIDFATYSYAESETAVATLLAHKTPLVLCSSKTRTEQQTYREALHIPDPFIVENGSAIFVPPDYFPFTLPGVRLVDNWQVIELGVPAASILEAIHAIRQQTGFAFQGYADLSVDEVAEVTGLDRPAAERAQQREYSETIVTPLNQETLLTLQQALAKRGLAIVSGGKFHTVMGEKSDKGTAVAHLTTYFRQTYGDIETIGLGDSANDAPLLAAVERPYLVQKPGGVWQQMPGVAVKRVTAIGPAGWRQVVEIELESSSLD